MPEPNDSLESQPAAGRAREGKRSGQASRKGKKEEPGSAASRGLLKREGRANFRLNVLPVPLACEEKSLLAHHPPSILHASQQRRGSEGPTQGGRQSRETPVNRRNSSLGEDMRLVKYSFWRWPTGRFSDLIHQVSALVITKQQWTQRHRIGTAAGSKSRKAFLDSGEFGARIPAEVLPSHPALYGKETEKASLHRLLPILRWRQRPYPS